MYAAHKNIHLVVNRVYNEKESRDVAEKLRQTADKFLNMPVDCIGYIFDDRNVMEAVRKQKPFLAVKPDSSASRCINAMAEGLLSGKKFEVKQGWRGFLQQIFNFSRK